MPIETAERRATLSGVVTVEEVEVLVAWLRGCGPDGGEVDLREVTHLHSGALQALLVGRPKVAAAPVDPFLVQHVLPLLEPATSSGTAQTRPGGDH